MRYDPMKRIALSALLFAVACFAAFAQEVVVAYVDGSLEVRDGSAWYELYIGDAVGESDQIRLGRDAYAELTNGQTTVKLSRPGTYEVASLIQGAGRTASTGVAGMVLNRIGRLTGREEEEDRTVAGGARASEAVNQNAPTWAGGETIDELIVEGTELLNDGAYQDAYYVFQEAYDYAISDAEYARALFYYGYASTLVGRSPQAFELLEEIGPDASTDYYASHVLALGQLLVESFAFGEAVDYLKALAEDENQAPEDIQSAHLLLGIAYDGLGDVQRARASLRAARAAVPGTRAAEAAERYLAEL
jgi:tetratricopeptide (TPR) repeat protein